MWSLLKFLFSRNYWTLVLRGHTWRAMWPALRRAHKDPRAWKQFSRVLFLLLVPLSIPILLFALVPYGAAIVWIFALFMGLLSRSAFGKRSKSKGLNIVDIEAELRRTPEVRRFLGELCLLHAVLAERAGSERFLHTKVLPEGFEVTTRRLHLKLLRERGLYERVGPIERDLLLMPDGHWPQSAVNEVGFALETVRLLRWVLALDGYLPATGETMNFDAQIATSLVSSPDRLFEADGWVSVSSVDTAIHTATVFWYRCWAEGVSRGIFQADTKEREQKLRETAVRLDGKEGEDLLLRNTIVSRASTDDLQLASTLAWRRSEILRWVRARIMTEHPIPEQLMMFYQPNLHEDEAEPDTQLVTPPTTTAAAPDSCE